MGKWHKPWQVAWIIEKIKQDFSIEQLYQFELDKGWTDASEKDNFWNNTKERIFLLTGKKFTTFINKNTHAYRKIIKYYQEMKKFKRDQKLWENLKDGSKEDLVTIIQILKEELEKEYAKKNNKEKNKTKCSIAKRMSTNTRFSERRLTSAFNINRKTYHNYKNVINHGEVFRQDFKHNDWLLKNRIILLFNELKQTQGAFKICGILNKDGIKITVPTVRRILTDSQLFVCTSPKKFKPAELKNTTHKREYLLTKDNIDNAEPGTLFSADFMYVQTSYGNRYVHGIIDVVSHQVISLRYSKTMTANEVLNSLKELPKTAKVINTDYGTQYFEKTVQNYLLSNNIKHSCGKPGKSTDNGWIERFWKRLRGECLNCHDLSKISDIWIETLIDEYKEFWNKKRVLSNLNWLTPNEFLYTKSGVN